MKKEALKMIKVYQIQLTDAEVDMANKGGTSARIKAFFDRHFDEFFKPENLKLYDHVVNVHTDDKEDAFRLMNLWEDESKIERIHEYCSSMSVGDILVMEDGKRLRCASFGFKEF